MIVRLLQLVCVWAALAAEATDADLAPLITEHPLDVIVSRGSPATLNCAAKPPGAVITWYKDGEKVTTNREHVSSHRIILDTGALFLLKVNSGKNGKDGDSGSYHCVAQNEHGEATSREGTLKIAMLRDDFRVRPRTVQALMGDRAVLECSPPRGFPEPVVSWRRDDKELRIGDNPRLSLHPDGNLIIEPVEQGDSGTYQCVATNMVGERVSNPARLSVYEKPRFITEPKDVTADAGSSVLFDCRVSGEPQPQISWKKKNEAMPVSRAYIAKDNRGLRIDRVQASDAGEYVCYARNPAGNIEASATLRVQAPPTFSEKPSDVSVAAGGVAVFECAASGQPAPALFWSREGQQNLLFPGHVSADGRIKVSSSGRLSLSDVRTADAGSYVCAAMNSAGSSLAKAQLSLAAKAASSFPPPIIEYGHSNQTLMAGSSAILPCQASGRTPPRVSWLRDGKAVEMDARFSLHSTGSLHIADIKFTDSGVYTCRAANEDGESTWTASLTVEGHQSKAIFSRMPDPSTFPSAPSTPVAANASDTEVDLEWQAPEKNGAAPITGYILQYYSPELGETWFNVPDYIASPRHRVKSLKPLTTYTFIVRAENDKGMGPPSRPSQPVTTKEPRPGAEPATDKNELDVARRRLTQEQLIKLEEVKTINSTAVRLFWKLRKNDDLIEGYFIQWRGPKATPDEQQWQNVSSSSQVTAVVTGLLPFTNYEFFVIPYFKTVHGTPSNSMEAITAEAVPTEPPMDVRIRMLNLTTLRVSWKAPKTNGINGILKGFQIVILGKGTKFNRNITTNERAASVTLFHMIPGMAYKIRVAARTNAGIGVAHGTDIITMNQETLEKHQSLHSEGESFFYSLLHRSWFIVLLTVLIWIFLIAVSVFIYLRYRRNKGKQMASDRLNPFIKINDGSVHMGGGQGVWAQDAMGYATTGRMTMGRGGGGMPPPQPLYSLTPNQQDFYHHDEYSGTMGRPHSEQHYHYAQLTGNANMSTFYGSQFQDDPSPYATTTLVMSNQQPAWLNDRMLRGPVLPNVPVPNGPPARYADHSTGRRSRGSRQSDERRHGDSPPHTDVSYVQSSDGTGGSTGRGTLSARRTPPKSALMDMIPPPPPGCPPPPSEYEDTRRVPPPRHASADPYDSVGDQLLNREQFEMKGRPTSRNRNSGVRKTRDDDSQRSSLMEGDSEEECSGEEEEQRRRRPLPCMGVSASTLNQTANYDSAGRSASRFKSMPRQQQPRNEHV